VACASSKAGAPASRAAGRDQPETWFAALPRDTRVAEVSPGRFASTIDHFEINSCSRSWASVSSRATVVLELAPDGSATGCRGRRYQNVDGPNDEAPSASAAPGAEAPGRIHEARYVEQQGMRGRWRREGRAVVVDLDLDAAICGARAENVRPIPWHLRCAALERPASAAATVRGPLLVCGWVTASSPPARPFSEWEATAGYATQEFIPGQWLVLAPGPGVRLTERGLDETLRPAMDVKWAPAGSPLPFDDWSASSP
jgi:hypothetical protein